MEALNLSVTRNYLGLSFLFHKINPDDGKHDADTIYGSFLGLLDPLNYFILVILVCYDTLSVIIWTADVEFLNLVVDVEKPSEESSLWGDLKKVETQWPVLQKIWIPHSRELARECILCVNVELGCIHDPWVKFS